VWRPWPAYTREVSLAVVKAPWDAEVIEALTTYQGLWWVHPYTCVDSTHPNLVPTPDGWICVMCEFDQDWAFSGSVKIGEIQSEHDRRRRQFGMPDVS
jgi:hypothetical protein